MLKYFCDVIVESILSDGVWFSVFKFIRRILVVCVNVNIC